MLGVDPKLSESMIGKEEYRVPNEILDSSEEIKKSRFLTFLAPVVTKAEMREWLLTLRQQHNAARHHCWACVAGAPWDGQQYGFSDDGEPSGTAGKPLLNLLLGSGLGGVGVIVVRYYGGIKLGTGGLVRAYSSGVTELLKIVPTRLVVPCAAFLLECDYDDLAVSQRLMAQFSCENVQCEYGTVIQITGNCPLVHRRDMDAALTNRSHGRVIVQWR